MSTIPPRNPASGITMNQQPKTPPATPVAPAKPPATPPVSQDPPFYENDDNIIGWYWNGIKAMPEAFSSLIWGSSDK